MVTPRYSSISLNRGISKNEQAVLDSIYNILHTRVGERYYNREFGSNIEDLLFEPFGFVTSRSILSELLYSITKWEPRAELINNLTVVTPNEELRSYAVELHFKIAGLEEPIIYTDTFAAKTKKV